MIYEIDYMAPYGNGYQECFPLIVDAEPDGGNAHILKIVLKRFVLDITSAPGIGQHMAKIEEEVLAARDQEAEERRYHGE